MWPISSYKFKIYPGLKICHKLFNNWFLVSEISFYSQTHYKCLITEHLNWFQLFNTKMTMICLKFQNYLPSVFTGPTTTRKTFSNPEGILVFPNAKEKYWPSHSGLWHIKANNHNKLILSVTYDVATLPIARVI